MRAAACGQDQNIFAAGHAHPLTGAVGEVGGSGFQVGFTDHPLLELTFRGVPMAVPSHVSLARFCTGHWEWLVSAARGLHRDRLASELSTGLKHHETGDASREMAG